MSKPNFKSIGKQLLEKYGKNPDPWGLDPKRAVTDLKFIWPIYKYYFDVKIHGKENIDPNKAYMVISNHTGQIPIDALLICTAFATELEKPRVLRPLVERFLNSLPFFGKWSVEGGAVLGDRNNCLNLLKRNESILVFPEGVTGIAKSPKNYYQLKPFTRGFYRMALTANVEILPICVVGAEDFYPFVFHFRSLAKILNFPALPISPNLVPLPSPIDIYIGKPYTIPSHLTANSTDDEIQTHINELHQTINEMTQAGLKNKRTIIERIKNL